MPIELDDDHHSLARAVINCMRHGRYEDCLRMVRASAPQSPMKAINLEHIVIRLLNPKKAEQMAMDLVRSLVDNKALLEELRRCHGQGVISDTVLLGMFVKAMKQSFEGFRKFLERSQLEEHVQMQNGLMLAQICNKMILVRRRIDKQLLIVGAWVDEKMVLLCGLIFAVFCLVNFLWKMK